MSTRRAARMGGLSLLVTALTLAWVTLAAAQGAAANPAAAERPSGQTPQIPPALAQRLTPAQQQTYLAYREARRPPKCRAG